MEKFDKELIDIVRKIVTADVEGYYFDLNPELIDVQHRFRLVEYNESQYIIKISNKKDAFCEIEKAQKAADRIDGKQVDGMLLKVIVPVGIEFESKVALLTPYVGKTLQSGLYDHTVFPISFECFANLLIMFKEANILYRGFLPRNTIMTDEMLYFIDWEDSYFFEYDDTYRCSKFWETNILLNWGYFFDKGLLKKIINTIFSSCYWYEPPLVHYEKLVCNVMGWDSYNISEVREKIEKLVLYAESPILETGYSGIPPQDCAHLIADMFIPEIDVLFDLLTGFLRKNNDAAYYCLIDSISNLIRKCTNADDGVLQVIFVILLVIDLSNEHFEIKNCIYDEIWPIWTGYYLSGSKMPALERKLTAMLRDFFIKQLKLEDKMFLSMFIDRIVKYSCSLSANAKKNKLPVFSTENWVLSRLDKYLFISGCYQLSRQEGVALEERALKECAFILKQIRLALEKNNMKLVGIYFEPTEEYDFLIIPFHINALEKLGISPDAFQPEIYRYLSEYPFESGWNIICERVDLFIHNWLTKNWSAICSSS